MRTILLSKGRNGRTTVYSTKGGATWLRHKAASVPDAEAEREAALWALALPDMEIRRHDAGPDGRPFPDDLIATPGFRVV